MTQKRLRPSMLTHWKLVHRVAVPVDEARKLVEIKFGKAVEPNRATDDKRS